MNGIDTSGASLLASRVDGLSPVGSQGGAGAGSVQAGVSALATGVSAPPDADANAQASAQTVLSAVALALDAIIRSGGEATPAVVGQAPLWADPDAAGEDTPGAFDDATLPLPGFADLPTQVLANEVSMLADTVGNLAELAEAAADASAGAAANPAPAQTANPSGSAASASVSASASTSTAAAVSQAVQSGAVAALATSLQQTVSGSGLFYESHLAQWLLGQRTPGSLADEPQNRLVDGDSLLHDRSLASNDADDVLWTEMPTGDTGDPSGVAGRSGGNAYAPGPNTGTASGGGVPQQNAWVARENASLADTLLLPAAQDFAESTPGIPVHPAVIPLVRQQLDLLATGEFRWNGEAWPGARLDWSIQQERYDPRESRHGQTDPASAPWRTRLTLALPSLGTVDVELTLNDATLGVSVQASAGGAPRLIAGSAALRGRLEALGMAIPVLTIREFGGTATAPDNGASPASAYARFAEQSKAGEAAGAARTAQQAGRAEKADWELS